MPKKKPQVADGKLSGFTRLCILFSIIACGFIAYAVSVKETTKIEMAETERSVLEYNRSLDDARYTMEGRVLLVSHSRPIEPTEEQANLQADALGIDKPIPEWEHRTSVTFTDGRSKVFENNASRPIGSGDYVEVIYNGHGEIVEVKVTEQAKDQASTPPPHDEDCLRTMINPRIRG